MKNFTPYVNVFQGCGEIALPKPEGIAAAWHFIKALTGNTTPAAVLPFGKYSCCMYTGGYPTGYGINKANYGGPIEKLSASPEFVGMSHFAQSGTGAIGVYYNYALTSPALSDKPDFSRRRVITESAEPGYYSVMIPDIFCEATVSQSAVLHRYTMAGNGNLSIDFSADGLYGGMGRAEVSGEVTACGKVMFAEMTLHGIKWYFAVTCEDALAVSVDGFVGSFAVTGGTHVMKLATSNKSMAHAEALLKKETRSFDVIRADAMKNWASALSAIEIDTDDARELEIFYSNFYHTLTKPSEFTGEAFLDGWGDDVPFMADLSTMWDIYKTQLPLVFTLYPDAAVKILGTLRRFAELTDSFPHCLMLASDLKTESNQARMLAEHTIADAFWRGIGADYAHLLCLCERDASRFAEDLSAPGGCRTAAHTVDITCAHRAMAGIARELGLDASAYDAVAAQ